MPCSRSSQSVCGERYPDLQYVAVIEFQDKNGRGAVHYHMVCNLPYIRNTELQQIWGNGFIKVNRIDHVDNVGAYVIKYMVLDMDDKRLCGEQAYLRSRGLVEPVEVCSWREGDREVDKQISALWERESPTYHTEYVSEYAGVVRYSQYNMNRISRKEEKIG